MSERSTAPANGNGDADADAPLLVETASTWVQNDPNPTTAAHVEQLIRNNESRSALRAMFAAGRIAFGTAGLRSSMAPGPLNMNDLVVIQAAQGIAQYCQRLFQTSSSSGSPSATATASLPVVPEDHKDKRPRVSTDTEGKKRLCVVIGYDHRASEEWNLSSRHFAVLTALVFRQLDCFQVVLLDGFVMTPLVPFAMQQQQHQHQTTTCYGIMVTASHNPKQDAGYKVYWSDGCQIRSPTDEHLAESIQANLTPWIDYAAVLQSQRATFPNDPCYGLSDPQQTKEYITEYFQSLLAPVGMLSGKSNVNTDWNDDASLSDQTQHRKRPTFCYTAMHGVGYRFAQQCFATCQLPPFVSVPQQQEPDPTFATVSFPNPEEPGALDIALQHAAEHDCFIVLANDPDADRLAVAERNDADCTTSSGSTSHSESNPWTIFTGDQIGVLLGHWLWEQYCQNSNDSNTVPAMCASTVSSRMLATIADVEGFHFEDTLTGFKWIGSRAAALHGSSVLVETRQSSSAVDSAPSSTTTTAGSAKQQMKTYKTLFCYEEASK